MVVALGLVGLRVFNMSFGDPGPFNPLRLREEALGNIVFILILATPYLAALFSMKLPAGARWLVLLPATIISLPAIFISFSLIGILFIPAIVFMFMATSRSLNTNSILGTGRVLGVVTAITIVVTVFTAGTLLFQSHNDARGWRYTTDADGHTEWESVPQTPQTPGRIGIEIQAPAVGTSGGNATSDIITVTEAANGGMLLLLAWIEIGVLGLYAVRRRPDEISSTV